MFSKNLGDKGVGDHTVSLVRDRDKDHVAREEALDHEDVSITTAAWRKATEGVDGDSVKWVNRWIRHERIGEPDMATRRFGFAGTPDRSLRVAVHRSADQETKRGVENVEECVGNPNAQMRVHCGEDQTSYPEGRLARQGVARNRGYGRSKRNQLAKLAMREPLGNMDLTVERRQRSWTSKALTMEKRLRASGP